MPVKHGHLERALVELFGERLAEERRSDLPYRRSYPLHDQAIVAGDELPVLFPFSALRAQI